ncbi:MAG: hypothetical protein IT324_06020 [Anaerolineae bacterium]|nr:hypothetical protein [Anaerolineae bacterium]
MRWLLKRALLLWLALIALCAAGVGIGKLDRTPDTLQTLGFDVCDGEPCFRGIKPGMSWEDVQKRFPDMIDGVQVFIAEIEVNIFPSTDSSTVSSIMVRQRGNLPFTVGNIVAKYGLPCRVFIGSDMILIYPTYNIFTYYDTTNVQLQLLPDVPIDKVEIVSNNPACNTGPLLLQGTYQGFTSAQVYIARYKALVTNGASEVRAKNQRLHAGVHHQGRAL